MPGVVAGFPAKPAIPISIGSVVLPFDGTSGYSRPVDYGSISPAGATPLPGVIAVDGDWEIYEINWQGSSYSTPFRVLISFRDNTGTGAERVLPFTTMTVNGVQITGFTFDFSYEHMGVKLIRYSVARATSPFPAGTLPVKFT